MLVICNVYRILFVFLKNMQILLNVKFRILVDNLLICVRLFVILKVHLLLVFHFYVLEVDSKITNYVKRLKIVNMFQLVNIKFGCMMIHSKVKIVVLTLFVEINVED